MNTSDSQTFCNAAIKAAALLLTYQFTDYPNLANKFETYCKEEGYDEMDILIEDVADGFEDSALLEAISEDIEIEENDKNLICHTIHQSLINFHQYPPTTLNLSEITHTSIDQKEMKDMRDIVKKEAVHLQGESATDDTLCALLIIAKRNCFPLLTYLVDTYIRWKFYKYERLFEELNKYDVHDQRLQFIRKYMPPISEKDFMNEFYAMQQLKSNSENNQQISKLILLYEHSIPIFYRRITASLASPFKSAYVINDSLVVYAKYFIAMLCAVNNLIQSPTTQLPLQIELWVIPRAMANNGYNTENESDNDTGSDDSDDTGNDDSEESKQTTQLDHLQDRLEFTDNLVKEQITAKEGEIFNLKRVFYRVSDKVIRHERHKRVVMVLDRRVNGQSLIENDVNYSVREREQKNEDKSVDQLYGFLPPNSADIPTGDYMHESMFNLTRDCILPSHLGNNDTDSDCENKIHSRVDMLNMCLLSVHIHDMTTIRAYWYFNGMMCRFYPRDIIHLWPLYFIHDRVDQDNGLLIQQNTDSIVEYIKEHNTFIPLRDDNFDTFFQENTKISPTNAYKKETLKPQNK